MIIFLQNKQLENFKRVSNILEIEKISQRVLMNIKTQDMEEIREFLRIYR